MGAVWTSVDISVDEGYLKISRGPENEEIMILPCGQPIIIIIIIIIVIIVLPDC